MSRHRSTTLQPKVTPDRLARVVDELAASERHLAQVAAAKERHRSHLLDVRARIRAHGNDGHYGRVAVLLNHAPTQTSAELAETFRVTAAALICYGMHEWTDTATQLADLFLLDVNAAGASQLRAGVSFPSDCQLPVSLRSFWVATSHDELTAKLDTMACATPLVWSAPALKDAAQAAVQHGLTLALAQECWLGGSAKKEALLQPLNRPLSARADDDSARELSLSEWLVLVSGRVPNQPLSGSQCADADRLTSDRRSVALDVFAQ